LIRQTGSVDAEDLVADLGWRWRYRTDEEERRRFEISQGLNKSKAVPVSFEVMVLAEMANVQDTD
jgi:hypothetical protein